MEFVVENTVEPLVKTRPCGSLLNTNVDGDISVQALCMGFL